MFSFDDEKPTITYRYQFRLDDGTTREFKVELDRVSLNVIPTQRQSYPAWTALSSHQCVGCPLKPENHPRCPIAANLVELVEFFKHAASYEKAHVEISTETRNYMKETSLQHGISSLLGIYMVTSGCPIMEKLKPMVAVHLPFATAQETTYRVTTMYLLAQFFIARRGGQPDWKLENLPRIYDDIRRVNRGFVNRLSAAGVQDASINAVILLDTLASYMHYPGDESPLGEIVGQIETLFHAYVTS